MEEVKVSAYYVQPGLEGVGERPRAKFQSEIDLETKYAALENYSTGQNAKYALAMSALEIISEGGVENPAEYAGRVVKGLDSSENLPHGGGEIQKQGQKPAGAAGGEIPSMVERPAVHADSETARADDSCIQCPPDKGTA